MEDVHILALAGLSCSGKTTVARLIARLTGAPLLPLDDYYLPLTEFTLAERHRANFDDPAIYDHELLRSHLLALRSGSVIEKPTYDFVEFTRGPERVRVEPHPLIILEGQYAFFWPEVGHLCDTKIFLQAEPSLCLERRLARDIGERGRDADEVHWRFSRHVLPMYERHVLPMAEEGLTVTVAGLEPTEIADRILELMRSSRIASWQTN